MTFNFNSISLYPTNPIGYNIMKLNTKTRYGLRAIIEIAMNSNEQGIFQKDIALAQNISNKYLDQIIAELKAADLITNTGGKKSGYKLTINPKSITAYTIFKVFNSSLQLVDCVSGSDCCKMDICAAKTFWCGLNDHIIKYLQSKTLEELVIEQKKLLKNNDNMMFYI